MDVHFESSIKLIQRATGFFSFWNKLMPAYAVLDSSSIRIYPSKEQLNHPITTVIQLSSIDYEIVQLTDYDNGLAIKSDGDKTILEFLVDSEDEMFKWMKYLIKTNVLKHQSNGDLTALGGPLDSLAIVKTSAIKKASSFSLWRAAVVYVVLKRALKQQTKCNAATKIQACFKMHRQKKNYDKTRKHIIKAQSFVRRWLHRNTISHLKLEQLIAKYQPHRTRVVMEIYATEESYIQQLDMLIKVFMKPLRALEKKAGVTQDQISLIFGNVEEIVEKHRVFYEELGKCIEQWSETTTISSPFIKMTEWLSIYIPYCNNFEEAKQILAKCQKIPAFQSFLDTVDAVKKLKRLDISSFLILPVQRIPRYELLLKDLIKKTWNSHPDFDGLNLALGKVREAAKLLNRAKSYNDSKHRIASIQSHIQSVRNSGISNTNLSIASIKSDPSAELEQSYVGEGVIVYQEMKKTIVKTTSIPNIHDIDDLLQDEDAKSFALEKEGKETQVYAFLFQDTIVLTKRLKHGDLSIKISGRNRSTFKYDHFMNISLDRAYIDTEFSQGKNDPSFILVTADERYHKFVTETVETKKKWVVDIQEALETLSKKQDDTVSNEIPENAEEIESAFADSFSDGHSTIKTISSAGSGKEKSKLFPKFFRSNEGLESPSKTKHKKGTSSNTLASPEK